MRFFLPASLSAAASLALGFSFGGATPASISLPAAPSIVRADGNVVAAAVPGDRKGRCAEIVLWRVGGKPVAVRTIVECDNDGVGLDAVTELALAGQTVAWQETNGGNSLEMSVNTATLTRPKTHEVSYVENGAGAAEDPAGDWTSWLAGHGSLLTFDSWTRCDPAGAGYARACSPGQPDVYGVKLRRIGGGILRQGPDVFHSVWTDGSSILIQHEDGSLLLVGSQGLPLRRFAAVSGLLGAVVQGSQLVTLTPTTLTLWNARTGARVRSFVLPHATRVLEDLDAGVAVLGSQGTTHLIRLSDGRGITFTHAAHAQLEPQGLYFTSGRTLRFVPRARVRFG